MGIWPCGLSRVSRVQQSKRLVLILCSLFLLGWYETRRDTPKYLSWLFKPDCVDVVWYFAAKLSIQRPEYMSNECDVEFHPRAFVTSYRILVSTSVVFLGSLKIIFTWSNILTHAIWVQWFLAGFILSLCVNFNLAQVNQILNYATPPLGSTSLVYIKTTR